MKERVVPHIVETEFMPVRDNGGISVVITRLNSDLIPTIIET